MGQSLCKLLVHLIFSTKHRRKLINAEIEESLHAYMVGIFRGLDSPSLLIGGTEDHIHALFLLSKNYKPKDVIGQLKSSSSKWAKTKGAAYSDFHWQSGYGAFSVSQSGVKQLKAYIRNQKKHHKTVSFKDEMRAFFKLYGIDYDERYIWD